MKQYNFNILNNQDYPGGQIGFRKKLGHLVNFFIHGHNHKSRFDPIHAINKIDKSIKKG